MSRLTSPPGSPRARADAAPALAVPGLAHPLMAPAEWAELARPGTAPHWAAFDVSRGPGSRPDPLYAEVVGRVRENGVPLLGTLDLGHGERPFGELVSEASRYLDWYAVDGFYLDRAPIGAAQAADCHWVVTTLRALLDREPGRPGDPGDPGLAGAPRAAGGHRRAPGHIVLGHGVHPHPCYAELADQLVTFAGPWDRYRWSEAPQWTAAHPPSRFVHLVHGLPGLHLDGALRIARWQGAGTLGLTDRTARDGTDPWAGLPGYWDRLALATGRTVADRPPPFD